MYRRNDVETAERKVKQGGAPAYLYEFTWKTPVLGGILKSPHTLCIPFAFGNIELARDFVGEGPEQEALQEKCLGRLCPDRQPKSWRARRMASL